MPLLNYALTFCSPAETEKPFMGIPPSVVVLRLDAGADAWRFDWEHYKKAYGGSYAGWNLGSAQLQIAMQEGGAVDGDVCALIDAFCNSNPPAERAFVRNATVRGWLTAERALAGEIPAANVARAVSICKRFMQPYDRTLAEVFRPLLLDPAGAVIREYEGSIAPSVASV